MVTHDLKVALKTGDYFVVINEKHNLAMTFERKDYEEKKEELNQILDHQPGTGGIDEK